MVVKPNLKNCFNAPTSPSSSRSRSRSPSRSSSRSPSTSPTHSAGPSPTHYTPPSPKTAARAHIPATPIKNAVKWAQKRSNQGVTMVADVENQKTPLVTALEMLEVERVDECLAKDDDGRLRELVKEFDVGHVLQPYSKDCGAFFTTTLHKVAAKGLLKSLNVLLKDSLPDGALDAPNSDGNTALMEGVKQAEHEVVKKLLDAGAHVNARNNNGESALHLVTYAIHRAAKPEEDLIKTANHLLDRPDIDLEAHNRIGLTPLSEAAERLPQGSSPQRGGLISFCRSLVEKGASLQEDGGSDTTDEVLRTKSALHAVLRGCGRGAAPHRPVASQFLDMMLRGSDAQQVKDFLRANTRDSRVSANSLLGSRTVLFNAVDGSNEDMVKTLLDAGADPWTKQITGELPLYRAASKGHFAILDMLLEKMRSSVSNKVELEEHGFEVLKRVVCVRRRTSKKQENHSECLTRLLQPDININYNQIRNGQSILHEAAAFNHQEGLGHLLQKGTFLGQCRYVLGENRGHVLESLQPGTLVGAMDGCISHVPMHSEETETENILGEDYTLRLDYRFLVPPSNSQSKAAPEVFNEMETLMEVSKSKKHRHAIKHPLVETLLYAKWRKALPFYLLNLFLYLAFVAILTAFVYCLKDLNIMESMIAKIEQDGGTPNVTMVEERDSQSHAVYGLMSVLVPLTLYMLVREVAQVWLNPSTYHRSIENYLEWLLIVIVAVLCFANLEVDTTRHLAAWAMIFAWYEFVLLLGRSPHLALYITMLRHVSWNFLKLIFLFGALILAFTISFNIILQPSSSGEDTDFSDFWSTLPKAIVMATGEFEYSDLNEQFSKKILFFTSAILIFMVFLFLIFLVLMNVMNGLAVTDTQIVVEDATLYSLMSRLELVYLIEALFLALPVLNKYRTRVQLLSGPLHDPIMFARVNKTNKDQRLEVGRTVSGGLKHRIKLDDDTATNLRDHRMHRLDEEEQERKEDRVGECLTILRNLQGVADRHPQVLQEAASSLRSARPAP